MIGEIVRDGGEWVDFMFSQDQIIQYSGGREEVFKGEVMTVRKSFLKEQK